MPVDPDRLTSVEEDYLHRCFRPQPAAAAPVDTPPGTGPAPIPRQGSR